MQTAPPMGRAPVLPGVSTHAGLSGRRARWDEEDLNQLAYLREFVVGGHLRRTDEVTHRRVALGDGTLSRRLRSLKGQSLRGSLCYFSGRVLVGTAAVLRAHFPELRSLAMCLQTHRNCALLASHLSPIPTRNGQRCEQGHVGQNSIARNTQVTQKDRPRWRERRSYLRSSCHSQHKLHSNSN